MHVAGVKPEGRVEKDGGRTHIIQHDKLMLYQLSYFSKKPTHGSDPSLVKVFIAARWLQKNEFFVCVADKLPPSLIVRSTRAR